MYSSLYFAMWCGVCFVDVGAVRAGPRVRLILRAGDPAFLARGAPLANEVPSAKPDSQWGKVPIQKKFAQRPGARRLSRLLRFWRAALCDHASSEGYAARHGPHRL